MHGKMKGLLLVMLIILTFSLTACEEEGSAEKAGKKLDNLIGSAKDKINDATK